MYDFDCTADGNTPFRWGNRCEYAYPLARGIVTHFIGCYIDMSVLYTNSKKRY